MVERKIKVPKSSAHFRNVYQCVNGEYTIGTNRKTTYSADEILSLQCKGEIQIPIPNEYVTSKNQRIIEPSEGANLAEGTSKNVVLPDSELLKVIHFFVSCKITEIMENINEKRQEFNEKLIKAVQDNDTESLHPRLKDFLKNKTKQAGNTLDETTEEGYITGICNHFLADKLFSFMDETALITLGILVREWMEKSISSVRPKKNKNFYLTKPTGKDGSGVLQELGTIVPTTDLTNMITLGSKVDETDELRKKKRKRLSKTKQSRSKPIKDKERLRMDVEALDGVSIAHTQGNNGELSNSDINGSQTESKRSSKKHSKKHSSSRRKALKLMKKKRTMF